MCSALQVSALINHLETGLGKKANITRAPITAGDVPMTYADVSHARSLLGYEPKVFLLSYSYSISMPSPLAG